MTNEQDYYNQPPTRDDLGRVVCEYCGEPIDVAADGTYRSTSREQGQGFHDVCEPDDEHDDGLAEQESEYRRIT